MTARIPLALGLLVRDGRMLLVHRSPSRSAYPDCWDLAGGHIEPGESPRRALIRECQEELGVRIRRARPIAMTVIDENLDVHAFLVTSWDGDPVNAAPEEHDSIRWCEPAELAGLTLAHPASLPDILSALERS
jgi:8-oxo-dGTP pyrophosphatase MutT (NUDIX family)